MEHQPQKWAYLHHYIRRGGLEATTMPTVPITHDHRILYSPGEEIGYLSNDGTLFLNLEEGPTRFEPSHLREIIDFMLQVRKPGPKETMEGAEGARTFLGSSEVILVRFGGPFLVGHIDEDGWLILNHPKRWALSPEALEEILDRLMATSPDPRL